MPGSSDTITDERLRAIKTLWRQPDTMTLWGLPYVLRPGQSAYNLFKAERDWRRPRYDDRTGPRRISLADWVYLGEPGWWGRRGEGEKQRVERYLSRPDIRGCVPESPVEQSPVPCDEPLQGCPRCRTRRTGRRER